MSFDDFKREFSDLEVCNVTLDSFDEDESSECTPANACITSDDKHADTEMCRPCVVTVVLKVHYIISMEASFQLGEVSGRSTPHTLTHPMTVSDCLKNHQAGALYLTLSPTTFKELVKSSENSRPE